VHESDKLGFRIILFGGLLIGGTYLLFQLFGDSILIALLAFVGMLALFGMIAKFFTEYNNKD
jgi:hypothetical protein